MSIINGLKLQRNMEGLVIRAQVFIAGNVCSVFTEKISILEVHSEIGVWCLWLFLNNLEIKNDFTKYFKENC